MTSLWFVVLLVIMLMPTSQGLSVYTNYGSKRVKFGSQLSFYVTSKNELHCFYEEVKTGADLKVSLNAVASTEYDISFRVTSPSAKFSEWKHGKNHIRHDFSVEEEGIYEVCATAHVTYGQVRLHLQYLAYRSDDIEEVLKSRNQDVATNSAINDKINKLTTQIYSMIFHQKQIALATSIDEKMQISNASFIKTFTLIQIGVIFVVGFIQTFTIRKFFNIDPNKIRI